jgi:hypothetical protein
MPETAPKNAPQASVEPTPTRPALRLVPAGGERADEPDDGLPPSAALGQTPRQTLACMAWDGNLPVGIRLSAALHLLSWLQGEPALTYRIEGLGDGEPTTE